MKLKKRPADYKYPVVCRSVQPGTPIPVQHTYLPGDHLSLRPEPEGVHPALNATVVEVKGEGLLVRALHAYFITPQERLVESGAEFEVAFDEVFHVNVP